MRTLNDIVDASAARFGTKPALIIRPGFRTRTWTYRDLADLVPRAARALADAGIARGDRVVIWGVNRPEYGIAFLAALRIGAILVPLDVNSLPDFAQKIVQRTRATAAIVSAQTRERALTLGIPLHDMEALPDRAGISISPRSQLGLSGDGARPRKNSRASVFWRTQRGSILDLRAADRIARRAFFIPRLRRLSGPSVRTCCLGRCTHAL